MPFQPHPRPILIQPDDPSIRLIALTQGYIAQVSRCDYEELSQWNWNPYKSTKGRKIVYAQRLANAGGKRKRVFMHKQIFPQWKEIDHIDGNGLNNTRNNLRDCLHAENGANRSYNSNNTSGYKGVFFHARDNYWFSSIGINGKYTWLGRSDDPIEAAKKYDMAALSAFGKYAVTNFPASNYDGVDLKKVFIVTGKQRNTKSKYKGVSWNRKTNRWAAEGRHRGERFYLGSFAPTKDGEEEAAHAYDRWVIQHRGPDAYTNFPRDSYQ